MVDNKHSTRIEFADRILDDLGGAVESSDNEVAKEAMEVLNNWDRTSDASSTGMLLFYNWARKFQAWNGSNFTEPWSFEMPNTTPDGIDDPNRAVRLLEEAATEINGKYGTLEVPWGDYYRIVYNDKNLPANGSDGSLGVFRVLWPQDADNDHLYAGGGDSWVGVIEFGDQINARVLLSYGNSTQEGSPHFGDQLDLFSRKELRVPAFTPDQVDADAIRVEILDDKGFSDQLKE
jgi:acyl-homoserine-lactone acylase